MNLLTDLRLSCLAQDEREAGGLGTGVRLRWTHHPLGDLFAVYDYNALEEGRGWTLDSSRRLVKVQYAFRH